MNLGYEIRPGDGAYYKGLRIQAHPEVHVYIANRLVERYRPGIRVLDVASGTGSLAQRLLDAGFDVHCTTWNDKLRVNAPTYHLDLDQPFDCRDVGNVPFDVIVASEIIEHVENPSSFLRSCVSALARNGLLIITTPNVAYVVSRLQWLIRGCPDSFAYEEVVHNRHISIVWPIGFEQIARTAGLRLTETSYLGGDRSGFPLYKRLVWNALVRVLGHTSSGAACVFLLTYCPEEARAHAAETTY